MLKTIRLYGKLGAKFGRVFRMAVATPGEAVRALCVQLPGFEREFMHSKDNGVGYWCFAGKKNLKPEELNTPNVGDIRIAPVYAGSKRGGIGQIILGAIIVVAAVWTGGAALAAAGGTAGATAGAGAAYAAGGSVALGAGAAGAGTFLGVTGGYAMAAQFGAAMMLGGVLSALTPVAKGLSTKDGPDNGASYAFNGAVNTTAQGGCVPVLYGRMIVGSVTLSSGMRAEDQL